MKLIVFTKKNCPNCPLAKKVCEEVSKELGIELEVVDVESDMIRALQSGVASTPSIVVETDNGCEVLFRSEVPSREELIAVLRELK